MQCHVLVSAQGGVTPGNSEALSIWYHLGRHSDYDRGGQKGLFWLLSQYIFRSMHLIPPKFCERSGIGQT